MEPAIVTRYHSSGERESCMACAGVTLDHSSSLPCRVVPIGLLHYIRLRQKARICVLTWITRSCRISKEKHLSPWSTCTLCVDSSSCLDTDSQCCSKPTLLIPNMQEKRSKTCFKTLNGCFQRLTVRKHCTQRGRQDTGYGSSDQNFTHWLLSLLNR